VRSGEERTIRMKGSFGRGVFPSVYYEEKEWNNKGKVYSFRWRKFE
jgi:hypothetical protein